MEMSFIYGPAVIAADLRCYYRGFMVLRNPQLLIP